MDAFEFFQDDFSYEHKKEDETHDKNKIQTPEPVLSRCSSCGEMAKFIIIKGYKI